MPKRMKDKNNTILVKFYDYISDKKINTTLNKLNIYGVRVSTLVNRWALEVPYWRENEYAEELNSNKIIEKVHGSFYSFNKEENHE